MPESLEFATETSNLVIYCLVITIWVIFENFG